MQNFIVLGYIPGTNIQITFAMWLVLFSSAAIATVVIRERYLLKAVVLSWYVGRLIKRHQLA